MTARPSPAGPACSPTGSSSASPPDPGETFIDRMIALVEGSERQKTPNEIALNILLAGLTIIFLLATVSLQPFSIYANAEQSVDRARRAAGVPDPDDDRRPALGDRHRGHGPAGAPQRARDERSRGRGGGRRATPCCSTRPARSPTAPARPPSSDPRRTRTSASSPTPRCSRAWPTRRRKGGRSSCSPQERYGLAPRELAGAHARRLHRADPDERGRLRRPQHPQGRGRLGAPLGRGERRHRPGRAHGQGRRRSPASAGRRSSSPSKNGGRRPRRSA